MPVEVMPPPKRPPLSCSFCGKKENEVRAIIGSVAAMICDECVWVLLDELARRGIHPPSDIDL
jgi:hypothetical protein